MRHVALGLQGAPSTPEDERPTLAERYGSAVTSSHLKAEADHRCDVDYLIAAGLLKDGLGSALLRLRAEYDAARALLRHVETSVEIWQERIAEIDAQAAPMLRKPAIAPAELRQLRDLHAEQQRVRAELAGYLASEHGLVLTGLKTLGTVRERVANLALALCTTSWPLAQEAAVRTAGRVLDAWLDPNCRGCDGRGFNGGTHRGEQVIRCKVCLGSRLRRVKVASTGEESRFAAMLADKLAELQRRAIDEMQMLLRESFAEV
jgi:hypothetical protein